MERQIAQRQPQYYAINQRLQKAFCQTVKDGPWRRVDIDEIELHRLIRPTRQTKKIGEHSYVVYQTP